MAKLGKGNKQKNAESILLKQYHPIVQLTNVFFSSKEHLEEEVF